MSAVDRILVRLPNWLGDLLMARPMMHGLRRAHPKAEIRGVAPASLLGIMEPDRVFDRLEPWPESRSERVALVKRSRAWRPGAVLVLPPSFSSAWFAFRIAAGRRIGFAHEARGALLTHRPFRRPRGELHLSEEYCSLGRELGIVSDTVPDLPVQPGGRDTAEALLAELGLASRDFMLFGPGASYGPAKQWPAECFAELGRHAVRRGSPVLVCGAPSEAELCAQVTAAIGGSASSLAGRTDLSTQAALCARATVCVCNDSGLAHLASAVGASTVVLFGSTSSAWTAPLGARVRVVQRAPVCSPCFRRTCVIGYRCLRSIGVAEVDRVCREVAA